MASFLIFDLVTGQIEKAFSGSAQDALLNASEGQGVIAGKGNDKANYINAGSVADRPVMPLVLPALEVAVNEPVRIKNIPVGVLVEYPGGELTISDPLDNFIELPFVEPGEYQFRLTKFPYQEDIFYASVTAA